MRVPARPIKFTAKVLANPGYEQVFFKDGIPVQFS